MREVLIRSATGDGTAIDADRVAQVRWCREHLSGTYCITMEVDGVADEVEASGLSRNAAGALLTELGYPKLAKVVFDDDWTPYERLSGRWP